MKKLITIVAMTILASGCSSTISDVGAYKSGTEITQAQLAEVELGSKKELVIKRFGQPQRKTSNSGTDFFYYDYQKISHFSANVSETIVFEFKDDLVINKYKTGYGGKSNNPLLDAANN
ncbi:MULTISPECIES: hypothetical protein [Pseudoalteromonas]|uniref:hypothetical protein n=1 Tax=Pseudoalteromonas TaxID=53246 RepID=UPI001EF441B1|nr:hypothetical protein [Pseudoalteromonas sp. Of11M-6]MCG7556081.1 hypothetical protein [Pseudoalteromonas sp. Of11M-6]